MSWKDIIDQAMPYVRQALGDAADNFIPTCEECGEMGIPIRCLGCQGFVCLDHAFINYSSREIICIECACELEGVGVGRKKKRGKGQGKEQGKRPSQRKGNVSTGKGYPWSVLGIPPNSSEDVINKAFRQKAAKCHPDKGGSKDAFQKLNDAKEVAIKIVRGG